MCRTSFADEHSAAELLVHESVHHFGISDEAFADAVAAEISRSGHASDATSDIAWLPLIEDYHKLLRDGPVLLATQLRESHLSEADQTMGQFHTAWKQLAPSSPDYDSNLAAKVCAYGWQNVCQGFAASGDDIATLYSWNLSVDAMMPIIQRIADRTQGAP